MTKSRKSKKCDSDAVNAKINAKKANPFANTMENIKKMNPFEVHINKEKFNILGRTCKHDKGLPGVSRAKANQKRKETLEMEYRMQHKNNQFRDRRIGKHLTGDQLTAEVMNARFLAEKMSQMKPGKSSRFNLNDDEVLTHRGQTLEEIEQFHDDRSDDDDDNNEKLDADFTEVAHFGGEGQDGKDRQSAIDDMILEQKRKKLEISKEKDEVQSLTDKLDSNYKQLVSLVGKMTKGDEKTKPPQDDYDIIMREMIFEPRGAVTDKLLSEEDIAKKEKERLEELEAERKRRMMGEIGNEETEEKPKHRSADDLDDSYFAIESVEVGPTLTYDSDGKIQLDKKNTVAMGKEEEESEESALEDELEHTDDQENSAEEEEDDASDDDDDDDENEDDDLSDLKYSASDDEEEQANNVSENKQIKKEGKISSSTKSFERTDLPFTIEMPSTYTQFKLFMEKYKIEDQDILLERLIKCNHPKLEAANREKVCKLFAFLLEYVNEHFADTSADNIREQFKLLSHLNAHLYDLLQLQPDKMSATILNVIKQKHGEYRKNVKVYPPLETVIFFKLVSNFYSTSDFRHPVVTPCYIFISQILSKGKCI